MAKRIVQKNDIIKLRIMQFVETKGFSKLEFYQKIDIAPSNFAQMSMDKALSSRTVAEILLQNPDLSAEWLLRGEGQMLRSNRIISDNMEHLENQIKQQEYIIELQRKLISHLEHQINRKESR